MCRNISNVLCVIGAPLLESTLAPRRSIAFRNSAGTWSRAPGKQFGVLDRWRDRHTRPARWSDTLRIRPVRWRKWNRIRIDLARLADPIIIWHWPPYLLMPGIPLKMWLPFRNCIFYAFASARIGLQLLNSKCTDSFGPISLTGDWNTPRTTSK